MTYSTPRNNNSARSDTPAGFSRALWPALVLVCLVGPNILQAQQDKLPKAEDVLDKYIEVTGGKAAYAKLDNRVTKATMEITGQGLKFSMTIYTAKPNKMYSLVESEVYGKIEKGTDGDVVWETNMVTGPQIKTDQERSFILRAATFDALVNWRKLYKKAETVGTETIDDKPCYKIVLTPTEGLPETRYYDLATNLLLKTELSLELPMGTIPMENYTGDYKKVDGILLPHQTRVMVMGQQRVMTIESIEHNVKIPKDRFKLPAEIQALVDEKKSNKTQAENP